MNAETFNARYPVGTPVVAYPGTRSDEGLVTQTRTPAWELGHGEPVVSVDGYAGGIALTHVDVQETACDWNPVQATTDCDWDRNCPVHGETPTTVAVVAAMGALPMPAGPAPAATPRWHQLRTELISTFSDYMPVTGATKATDALDKLLAELGGRTAGAAEYGIRIPDGDVLLDGDTTDRAEQEERLDRYRGKALWPDAVLVQRPVFHGEWTEVK